ncbi:hypothetical protein HG530_005898 [Fusarium avenaceum]|nr:hypothetical protein HG530_005898 [Fusarium avenaceum]
MGTAERVCKGLGRPLLLSTSASSSCSLKNSPARMVERMRRIEDWRTRGSSEARRKASLTTAVTVEERGDGDMKVLDRVPEPAGLVGLASARGRSDPSLARGSLSGVVGWEAKAVETVAPGAARTESVEYVLTPLPGGVDGPPKSSQGKPEADVS